MLLRIECMNTKSMGESRQPPGHMAGRNRAMRTMATACTLSLPLLIIGGCASTPAPSPGTPSASPPSAQNQDPIGFLSDVADKALVAAGLARPEPPKPPELPNIPDSALPDWRVNWRLHASDSLNVDERGQSLALLIRIYKLRSPEAFLQAPYDTFGEPAKEKSVLAEDLLAVRELQLLPGQRHEALDKISRDARYLGVVALYRNPSAGRWRYAFSTSAAASSGLHLGVHACAMSVQVGEAIAHHPRSTRATSPCVQAAP